MENLKNKVMKYKVEFEIDCSDATEKDIKKGLKYLLFPDIDDIVSFPEKIKVKAL